MKIDDLVNDLLNDSQHFDRYAQLLQCWPDDEVNAYVEQRKQAADDKWHDNPSISLEHANVIIGIGAIRRETRHLALGMMARGDALKLLGRAPEAWDTLELAGELYLSINDEVGWARTRIGRLYICADLHRIDEALADSQQARAIFEQHGEHLRAFRLDLNTSYFYTQIGKYRQALEVCLRALETVRQWGEEGRPYLGALYTNLGYACAELGDLRAAADYHRQAQAVFLESRETRAITMSRSNLANLAILQGRYRSALDMLLTAHDEFPVEEVVARRLLIKCYLHFNRFKEAREQARELLEQSQRLKLKNETGFILMSLAAAEMGLSNLQAARQALDDAESLFTFVRAQSWVANVRLLHAKIALRQGDTLTVQREAAALAEYFQSADEQVSYAEAVLLQGQAAALCGDWPVAGRAAADALRLARRHNLPALRYSSHLLLGRVAEATGSRLRAARRYSAAAHTVERIQRDLTITLRPGFMESNEEGLRGLMRLYLEAGQAECAFQTLERTKSQTLLNHLANRENLHWLRNDPRSQPLIEELECLRQDYHLYEQLARGTPEKASGGVSRQQAAQSLAACERRMRAITEQLYLLVGDGPRATSRGPAIGELQARLDADDLLIEFYNDGSRLWAFTLDTDRLRLHPLKTSPRDFAGALREFEFTRDAAVAVGAFKGPHSPEAKHLSSVIQHNLRQLYQALLAPLASYLSGRKRIVMIPFGALHYLPFHLLRSENHYLIEQHEMVVLPAAGLLLADSPRRPPGSLVLTHDDDGKLPQTASEGRMVCEVIGGDLYCNADANRSLLRAAPRQVLHIAAHGRYRMDQPDFSCIYLGDGPLWSDDLFQHDLSYELVTLSACETGRARAVSGDELIGLGRGFLYSGAGALIASLWRIDDGLTIQLMQHLYQALQGGWSKSAALQRAQIALLAEIPDLNPVYWGAFQLIGSTRPLSS
jgi:tetratricopeptide (TPR) repeat protein